MRWATSQMDALEAHFATHPYLLGERATRFDYGRDLPVLRASGAGPSSRRELLQPRPNLHAWVWRMNPPYLVGEAPPLPAPGSPLPGTLQPFTRSIFEEMLPYLESTLEQLHRVVPTPRAGARIPRFLGMVEVPFGDGTIRRETFAFTLWLVQRILDMIDAMQAGDVARVRQWLADCGGSRLLDLDIPRVRVAGLTARFE